MIRTETEIETTEQRQEIDCAHINAHPHTHIPLTVHVRDELVVVA